MAVSLVQYMLSSNVYKQQRDTFKPVSRKDNIEKEKVE
jgi:hypothetical protein